MKKILLTLICFATIEFANSQAFQLLYPLNTSLNNPQIMNSYDDTARGKIIFKDWPFAGNIIINSFNISNSNFPCGTSSPVLPNFTYYLNEIYSGSTETLCYSSGPYPDTIKFDIREGSGTILAELYYLIDTSLAPASFKEPKKTTFKFYPNPCNDFIQLELKNEEIYIAQILDLNGKIIKSGPVSKYQSRIDLKLLKNGFYILKLIDKNHQSQLAKFIKQE